RFAVALLLERDLPEVDLIATSIPADRVVAQGRAAPADSAWGLGHFGGPEHELAVGLRGNLVENLVVDAMDGEDAWRGPRLVGRQDLGILLQFSGLFRAIFWRLVGSWLGVLAKAGPRSAGQERGGEQSQKQDAEPFGRVHRGVPSRGM